MCFLVLEVILFLVRGKQHGRARKKPMWANDLRLAVCTVCDFLRCPRITVYHSQLSSCDVVVLHHHGHHTRALVLPPHQRHGPSPREKTESSQGYQPASSQLAAPPTSAGLGCPTSRLEACAWVAWRGLHAGCRMQLLVLPGGGCWRASALLDM
jgi:hypothetical protein